MEQLGPQGFVLRIRVEENAFAKCLGVKLRVRERTLAFAKEEFRSVDFCSTQMRGDSHVREEGFTWAVFKNFRIEV